MVYHAMNACQFFLSIRSEHDARLWLWRAKFQGRDFRCPRCACEEFYRLRTRPEVRKCRRCRKHVRLRSDTMLEHSKLPLLTWLRAMFLMMQDKRGISALGLKRQLGMKSYGTTWWLLHKIRHALFQRDDRYGLSGLIELDGADFRRQAHSGWADVLVAVETKAWIDDRGRPKSKAGFAKVVVGRENANTAYQMSQNFVAGSCIHSDGGGAFHGLPNVTVESKPMYGDKRLLDSWLPWVHRVIANAKSWIIGTHHGIKAKYLPHYLAEYIYRFNRRHDLNGLFHRALLACAVAFPRTRGVLSG